MSKAQVCNVAKVTSQQNSKKTKIRQEKSEGKLLGGIYILRGTHNAKLNKKSVMCINNLIMKSTAKYTEQGI